MIIMQDITKMIERFNYKKLDHCFYGKAHNSLIGEWVNWWLIDSRLGDKSKRSIIDPAFATSNSEKKFADLMFAEFDEDNQYFKILGIAEVENNPKKYIEKIDSLSAYESVKSSDGALRFPDLEFAILATRWELIGRLRDKDRALWDSIENRILELSKKSNLIWIFYMLKLVKTKSDYLFNVPKYEGFPKFNYYFPFVGTPNYVIIKKGEVTKYKVFDTFVNDEGEIEEEELMRM